MFQRSAAKNNYNLSLNIIILHNFQRKNFVGAKFLVNSKAHCVKTQNYMIDISKMVRDIKKFKASAGGF